MTQPITILLLFCTITSTCHAERRAINAQSVLANVGVNARSVLANVGDHNAPSAEDGFTEDAGPQELLRYARSDCGKLWPKTCADDNSDGFLCHMKEGVGVIWEMTVYKNDYNTFASHGRLDTKPRCFNGKCLTLGRQWKRTGATVKTISEIGKHLCTAAKAKATPEAIMISVGDKVEEVKVKVTYKEHIVQVDKNTQVVQKDFTDVSLQLSVPIAAVAFKSAPEVDHPEVGFELLHKIQAKEAIKSALDQLEVLKTATSGRVCAHGFTNAAPAIIDDEKNRKFFHTLMGGRADVVSTIALSEMPNANINTKDNVVHMQHVDTPCAGLIIKLNGASTEECKEEDWVGEPL